jgi:predicted dehydrogenase
VETPWDHFPFLRSVKRLEILYHSVHHIDCIRHFLGDPQGIHAKTLTHPELDMPSSRSAFILDYGERVRANIQTNHFHKYGPKHQESYIKWEGTKGAIKATMGLLMNYPEGVPDVFEVCTFENGRPVWETVPIEGSWFPHAFVGAMAQVMRAADGEQDALVTPVEDSIRTMACVEAAYASSAAGGVDPRSFFGS